ncbi:MAG TPA: hypothetical protein VFI27_18520 [candidate division Zixibacteria bacterium]|nr:hypothetical protein [candidate division Zixibacteria bacterium]
MPSAIPPTTLIAIAIGVIVIVEIVTTAGYDKYHRETGHENGKVNQERSKQQPSPQGPAEIHTFVTRQAVKNP